MRIFRSLAVVSAVGLLLAACGDRSGERAVTGAGIGAAAGSVVGAVTGLSVLQGALIGAGVGGLTGAVTDKSTLNIGDPVWKKRGEGQTGQGISRQTLSQIQAELAQQGYRPGPADGIYGRQTAQAIRDYQQDHRLLVDGRPSRELLQHIRENG